MAKEMGIATVSVAPFGVSPNGLAREKIRQVTLTRAPDVFGGTPKTAGATPAIPMNLKGLNPEKLK